MAISLVSRASYDGDNGALPSFLPGDVAIAHGVNVGLSAPSAPAGWDTIASGDMTSSNRTACAVRVLQEGDTSTGVWGNTTQHIQVAVYRGVDPLDPIGAAAFQANSGGNGICLVPNITLQNTEGRSWVVWLGTRAVGPGCGDSNMHSRTHPTGRVTNRSSGQTVECLGHGDSNGGETDWTSVGNMANDNGSFDKGFFSIELLAGPALSPTRIVDDALDANRFFVQDVNGHWRMSDTDDDGAILGRDLTHSPIAARIFTLD